MNRKVLILIIGVLQGASWAFAILLPIYFFLHYYHYNFLLSFILALLGAIVGLALVAVFELINIQIQKLSIMEKNSKMLKDILEKLTK